MCIIHDMYMATGATNFVESNLYRHKQIQNIFFMKQLYYFKLSHEFHFMGVVVMLSLR